MQWYFACPACTAKWFAPDRQMDCPRCGTPAEAAEQRPEPWKARKLLLTAKEVAAMLQVSLRTFWRLKSAGEIPAPVRLGGSVRWPQDTILEWIAAGCPQGEQV